jgi:hypothetical protein
MTPVTKKQEGRTKITKQNENALRADERRRPCSACPQAFRCARRILLRDLRATFLLLRDESTDHRPHRPRARSQRTGTARHRPVSTGRRFRHRQECLRDMPDAWRRLHVDSARAAPAMLIAARRHQRGVGGPVAGGANASPGGAACMAGAWGGRFSGNARSRMSHSSRASLARATWSPLPRRPTANQPHRPPYPAAFRRGRRKCRCRFFITPRNFTRDRKPTPRLLPSSWQTGRSWLHSMADVPMPDNL